jgi:triosephosphate isomerase
LLLGRVRSIHWRNISSNEIRVLVVNMLLLVTLKEEQYLMKVMMKLEVKLKQAKRAGLVPIVCIGESKKSEYF